MAKVASRWVPGLYRPCWSQISSQPLWASAACSVIASAQVAPSALPMAVGAARQMAAWAPLAAQASSRESNRWRGGMVFSFDGLLF